MYEKYNILYGGCIMSVKGKHIFGTVRIGEKGQVVIPAEARKMYDFKPGDTLLVLGDEVGIAMVKNEMFLDFANAVLDAQRKGEDKE